MEDINLLSDLSRLAGSALGEKRSGLSKTLTANCAAMFTDSVAAFKKHFARGSTQNIPRPPARASSEGSFPSSILQDKKQLCVCVCVCV
uniref:Uncharacterized protein LOC105133833 n=1 Tax=Rhizophora mucronata TaxID=61149 RepID=A0A2P2JM92_RHIMU